MDTKKKLYKNKAKGKILGVCAGLSEYFEIDVTLVRVAWIFLVFAFGSGFLAYLICALVMPDKTEIYDDYNNYHN